MKEEIVDVLHIQSTGAMGTYSGCLHIAQRRPNEDFEEFDVELIRDLLVRKPGLYYLQVSVLIKFNFTGISQYVMNRLKFPKYICKDIDRTKI